MSTSSEVTALTERDNFLTRLAEAIGSRANAATVFGEPIVRDRTTVVPVACARWGFGGGGEQQADQSPNARRGFGGGGGMVVRPVGYLVITDRGDVKYHPIHSPMRILTVIMAAMLLRAILRGRARR
jgi:uncharacterized spore protein YtfJ